MMVESAAETPRPAAAASGTLPIRPIAMVVTAAARAVAVVTWLADRWWPLMSAPDSRIGFSTMM